VSYKATLEGEAQTMVLTTRTRWVALATTLAFAVPAGAAHADATGPQAHAAGSDAAPINPAIVGVPIQRTDAALAAAADAIDAGNGAAAAGPLTASRRHLLRSYAGAKYLIANAPPPAAEAGSVRTQKFLRLARTAVRASHRRAAGNAGWIHARASDDGPAGPVIADAPTAVFNVLTSQYDAATAAVGIAPDTKGTLLSKVKTALNTAIVLRNRLVKVVHTAAPPAPAEEGRVHAHTSQAVAGEFDAVMPGLTVLLDDELQQMKSASQDADTPADVKAILTSAIAADTQIEALVNQFWPPAPAEG
jgi:hypothetical protein